MTFKLAMAADCQAIMEVLMGWAKEVMKKALKLAMVEVKVIRVVVTEMDMVTHRRYVF